MTANSYIVAENKISEIKLPVLQSPTVACLYKAYNSRSSSSVGLAFSFLTSSAALSNFWKQK